MAAAWLQAETRSLNPARESNRGSRGQPCQMIFEHRHAPASSAHGSMFEGVGRSPWIETTDRPWRARLSARRSGARPGGSGASSTAEKPAALTRPRARSASAAMASRIVQSWSAAESGLSDLA